MKINPTSDNLLVEPLVKNITKGGIILVDPLEKNIQFGKVVAVGPGAYSDGNRVPLGINIGDTVIYGIRPRMDTLDIEGKKMQMLNEYDIRATVTE